MAVAMVYQVGQQVGDYEIVDIVGRGGMGCVYKVRNVISQRVEAMKVLLADTEADPEVMKRFLREIRVVATLRHAHIAGLLTAQHHGNHILMLMEFVEGESLDKIMAQGRIPAAEAVRYAAHILDALEYAHAKGVVHRDVKPQNILITPQGDAVLTDFGIAIAVQDVRLTRTGTSFGTLYYMSPEQVGGAQVDLRSDLYSMGLTVYEMVTGQRPIGGTSAFAVISAQVYYVPPAPAEVNPEVPYALSESIMASLAKEPAERFQSASAMRASLETAMLAGANVVATLDSPPPTPQQATSVSSAAKPGADSSPATGRTGLSRRAVYVMAGLVAALILSIAVFRFLAAGSRAAAPTVEPTGPAHPVASEIAPGSEAAPSGAQSSLPPQSSPRSAPPESALAPAVEDPSRSTEPGSAAASALVTKPAPSGPHTGSVPEGHLLIESEPSGASVSVDDGTGACTTPCSIELVPGRHVIKAGLAGYRDALSIVTTPHDTQVLLCFTRKTGSLALRSEPSDAMIFVNGKRHPQNTPALVSLPEGKYTIELRKQGFQDYSEEVEVRDLTTRSMEVRWK